MYPMPNVEDPHAFRLAYEKGGADFHAGISRCANPYPFGSELYQAWAHGHRDEDLISAYLERVYTRRNVFAPASPKAGTGTV